MKSSTCLVQLLITVACIINAANAFNAPREICRMYGQSQVHRNKIMIFEKPPFLEKEVSEMEIKEESETKKASTAGVKDSGEEMTETQKLMKQVKESGVAGIISYALWEFGFWTISVSFLRCL